MSLFPYPGGKTSLCRKIVDYLMRRLDPSIEEYREPFVGGGSVATHFMETHPEIPNVWLNDRDPGVASIWLATRDAAAQFGDLIVKFEPTVEAFSEYRTALEWHNLGAGRDGGACATSPREARPSPHVVFLPRSQGGWASRGLRTNDTCKNLTHDGSPIRLPSESAKSASSWQVVTPGSRARISKR